MRAPLRFEDIQARADALHSPPHLIDESSLWQAYAALQKGKVKGSGQKRLLTDIVSLVREMIHTHRVSEPTFQAIYARFGEKGMVELTAICR